MSASEEADDLALRLYDNSASPARRRRSAGIHLKSGGRGCFPLVACNTKIPQRWNTPEPALYSPDANLVSAYKARFPERVKSTPESLCFAFNLKSLPSSPSTCSVFQRPIRKASAPRSFSRSPHRPKAAQPRPLAKPCIVARIFIYLCEHLSSQLGRNPLRARSRISASCFPVLRAVLCVPEARNQCLLNEAQEESIGQGNI